MLSKANPEKYGSVTIDGSDQACYGLPYFSQKTHERCNSNTEKYFNLRIISCFKFNFCMALQLQREKDQDKAVWCNMAWGVYGLFCLQCLFGRRLKCAGGLIGIGLRQHYSDLLFPCGSQIQSILLYLSQSQCIILCFKPMKLQVSILQKMLELYVAEGKPLPSVLFLQVI